MNTYEENLKLLQKQTREISRNLFEKSLLAGTDEYPDKYPDMTPECVKEMIAIWGEESYLEYRYGLPNSEICGLLNAE